MANYSYTNDRNHYLSAIDYGNGDRVQYTYDNKGRVTQQTYEDGDTVSYAYDNNGALASVWDSATEVTTKYYYDFTDRMMKYVESGEDYSHSVGYEYDSLNNLTELVENINGTERTTTYTYDDDNRIKTSTTGNITVEYDYDSFGRVSTQTTKNGNTVILTESYTYKTTTSTTTSAQIATYTTSAPNGYSVTYSYTYDDNGNITSVSDGTNTITYEYDSSNQLIRENNQTGDYTYVWEYDNAGNILSRLFYDYTTGQVSSSDLIEELYYEYDDSPWGDLLTAHDEVAITYDQIGNPLNDGEWTYTWERGRQLTSMSKTGTVWNYTYNTDGLRTQRANGTNTYSYIYNGSSLSQMSVDSNTLHFTYDANGTPLVVIWNGSTYYYVTNLQGDVTAILDSSRTAVVNYKYDAWGKLLATTGAMVSTLGTLNPLRYRGYVYDFETSLYYLQSRYYNPTIGRFISADGQISGVGGDLLGYNQFAYCFNNPVNMSDDSGKWPKLSTIFQTIAMGALAVAATAAVVAAVAVAAPAFVAIGGTIFSSAAIAASATTVGAHALVVTAVAATASVASSTTEKKNQQSYSVYFLEDQEGTIQYVGRVTDRGYNSRMDYHRATRNLTPAHRISNLSYAEARGLEEIGMIECHTLNASNPINNQIHGISDRNPNGGRYMNAACNYLFNHAEDWVLNLFE